MVAKFAFTGYAVTKKLFLEVPPPPGADPTIGKQPGQFAVQLGTTVQVKVARDPLRSEVFVRLTVQPDPAIQPYHIETEVVGAFLVLENGTEAELLKFSQDNAPTILFPYLRALIHELTSDGRYGPVRLNPMNIRNALSKGGWEQRAGDAAKAPTKSAVPES